MKLSIHRIFGLLFMLVVIGVHHVSADICIGDTFTVTRVVGHVIVVWRDAEQPVADVRVELRQSRNDEMRTQFTATTDQTGSFHFDNVPPGRYQIQFTSPHYVAYGGWIRLKASRSKPKREIVVTVGPAAVHFCATAKLRDLPRAGN